MTTCKHADSCCNYPEGECLGVCMEKGHKHTPGPWRWEFNAEHRRLHLVGGQRRFDLTIMDFERWGMNGATMRMRDPAHDGMQLLYRVHERPDWIKPELGREHHKSWHQLLNHPDARLIEAAPDLLADLVEAAAVLRNYEKLHRAKGTQESDAKAEVNANLAARFEATIAKATSQEGGSHG